MLLERDKGKLYDIQTGLDLFSWGWIKVDLVVAMVTTFYVLAAQSGTDEDLDL